MRGVTIGLLMIDFDVGMNFIESERDNKHKTTTYDCTCNLKNLLKIITGVLYLSDSFWLKTFWSVRISNSWS